MTLYEVKKFLESKRKCQSSEEAAYRNERKIATCVSDIELVSRIYEELKTQEIEHQENSLIKRRSVTE